MDTTSINAVERALAAKFERQQQRTQDFTYDIEPALGAGARRVVIRAETKAEADLKAKQAAQDMFNRECLIEHRE